MSTGPVSCSCSVIAYFPPSVYNNVGGATVLPQLIEGIGRDKLNAVQFLRHGACRLTFKDAHMADSFMLDGLLFARHRIRLSAVEPRFRLVYLRDLPCEVPDATVRAFLRPFGQVQSIRHSEHDGFPGLFDGSRVIKMSLDKDIPPAVQLAGFECRVWYSRQPQKCPVCGAPGHRVKELPPQWSVSSLPSAPAHCTRVQQCLGSPCFKTSLEGLRPSGAGCTVWCSSGFFGWYYRC